MNESETTYLLLGSNLGDREAYLEAACRLLSALEGLEVIGQSPVYISEPVGVVGDQPTYLNQVIKGEYKYLPSELLASCVAIELKLGRTGKGHKLPRTIDIDILLFGEGKFESESLIIPHVELINRAFALVPLLEIDPELTHPLTGKKLDSYLSEKDAREILLYKDHVSRNFTA